MELADRIQRTGSLYESDPYEQLLKAFQKRNLDRFNSVLESGEILDINHYYERPEYGTILDLCAMQENTSYFLKAVMKFGANPNVLNRLRNKAPLHSILERNDFKCLLAILEFSNVDVNMVDSNGDTPLHYVAKGGKKGDGDTKALQVLLKYPNIDLNVENRKGQTPAHLAASQSNKDALLLLVHKHGIDLHSSKDFNDKSAFDLIKEKYDDIILLDKNQPPWVSAVSAFSLLRANNTEAFKEKLKHNRDLMNEFDGNESLFQYACNHGMYQEVDFLIQLGVNVNEVRVDHNAQKYSPLMLAARKGYYRILERLTNCDVDIFYCTDRLENVLHCVINGSVEESELGDSDEGRNHLECLDVLLEYASKLKLERNVDPVVELINRGDSKGYTPLHCAGRIGNEEMVLRLLKSGAYFGCVNAFGDSALSYISPSITERYLDSCVRTNEKLPREESYEIIIDYKCLLVRTGYSWKHGKGDRRVDQSAVSCHLNETDLLLYISNSPDLKHLLMHPVLKSLIYMKWFNIRKWFYVNLLFYLFFWAFLSAYILGVYDPAESHEKNQENSKNINDSFQTNNATSFIWYLVSLLLVFLIVRELFQFKKSCLQYVSNPENWLEVSLIVLTIVILFANVEAETKHQLAATAILFSWTDLVLLIGKHPALSTHIEMLKTVGWNFLKFLAWYSILIVAFALSFYTLFRNGQRDDDDTQVFIDPGVSVFKTIVMLTGEFETGDIPFHRYPITSHMIFVLFVFAIAIVLYNLLNGLAVSDTQAIKSDAEMVGYVSRIKLVSYVETIDLVPCKKIFSCFENFNFSKGAWISECLSTDKTVFSFMTDDEIHIYPNNNNKVQIPSMSAKHLDDLDDPVACCLLEPCNCKNTVMDSTIVKSAQILLNRRHEGSENFTQINRVTFNDKLLDGYKRILDDYKNVLKNMMETEKRIRTLTESLKIGDNALVTSFKITNEL